jgi:hypothetical protein
MVPCSVLLSLSLSMNQAIANTAQENKISFETNLTGSEMVLKIFLCAHKHALQHKNTP